MNPLPTPTAPPLHILPPASRLALIALVVAFLLALVLALVWQFWRRRKPKPPAVTPNPSPAVQAPVAVDSLGSAIESLEQRILRTKAFRDGCHALAVLIKKHLEKVTGLGVEEMTSAEIEQAFVGGVQASPGKTRIGGAMLGAFMTRLSARRYGRDEPRRRHFVDACSEARRLLDDDSTGTA